MRYARTDDLNMVEKEHRAGSQVGKEGCLSPLPLLSLLQE